MNEGLPRFATVEFDYDLVHKIVRLSAASSEGLRAAG
jgi:hypothetical protein